MLGGGGSSPHFIHRGRKPALGMLPSLEPSIPGYTRWAATRTLPVQLKKGEGDPHSLQ